MGTVGGYVDASCISTWCEVFRNRARSDFGYRVTCRLAEEAAVMVGVPQIAAEFAALHQSAARAIGRSRNASDFACPRTGIVTPRQ